MISRASAGGDSLEPERGHSRWGRQGLTEPVQATEKWNWALTGKRGRHVGEGHCGVGFNPVSGGKRQKEWFREVGRWRFVLLSTPSAISGLDHTFRVLGQGLNLGSVDGWKL